MCEPPGASWSLQLYTECGASPEVPAGVPHELHMECAAKTLIDWTDAQVDLRHCCFFAIHIIFRADSCNMACMNPYHAGYDILLQ